MKKEIIIFSIFLILLNLISVFALSPVYQLIDKGIVVEYPKIAIVPINENYTFHFHTFNSSNGAKLDNSSLTCTFHLYDQVNSHILEKNYNVGMESNLIDWFVYADKNNFSSVGDYSYIFQCNSTAIYGGAASVNFRVAANPVTSETSESIFYFLMTLIVFFFFIAMAIITYALPYSNVKNDKGQIHIIPKAKYIKLSLIPITYALFVWLLNLLVGISDYFITLNMYYGLIAFMFSLFMGLSYPLFVFVIILFGYNILRDIDIYKQIKKFGSANNG